MRDPNRIDPMLEALGKRWKEAPDLRLGQLVCNLAVEASQRRDDPEAPSVDPFYVEDDRLLEVLEEGMIPSATERAQDPDQNVLR